MELDLFGRKRTIFYCFRCGAERPNKKWLDTHIRKSGCTRKYMCITKRAMIRDYDEYLPEFLECKKKVDEENERNGTALVPTGPRMGTLRDSNGNLMPLAIQQMTGGMENFDFTIMNDLAQASKAMAMVKENSTNTTNCWNFDINQDIVVNNYSNDPVTPEYMEKVIKMAKEHLSQTEEPFLYFDIRKKRIVFLRISVKETDPPNANQFSIPRLTGQS